jgi:hypothetical protein
MGVRADDQLPRQGILLSHQGVRDALRPFSVRQVTMRPQAIVRHECPVCPGEFMDLREQTTLNVHTAPMCIGVMILEDDDRLRLVEADGLAERFMQHVAAHSGVYVVYEPDVGPDEASCPRHQNIRAIGGFYHMASQDLLEQGSGILPVRHRLRG